MILLQTLSLHFKPCTIAGRELPELKKQMVANAKMTLRLQRDMSRFIDISLTVLTLPASCKYVLVNMKQTGNAYP